MERSDIHEDKTLIKVLSMQQPCLWKTCGKLCKNKGKLCKNPLHFLVGSFVHRYFFKEEFCPSSCQNPLIFVQFCPISSRYPLYFCPSFVQPATKMDKTPFCPTQQPHSKNGTKWTKPTTMTLLFSFKIKSFSL